MAKNLDRSPFLFPSTFTSCPSESAPSSSSSPLPPSFCSSRSNSSFNSPYKSSSRPPLSHSSSTHFPPANFGPCAACQVHNRRCSDKCYIASFLPPNEVHNFAVVDSVFGSGNVVNFLQHNSNTSYTPLLLLLSREDEVDSDPKINTEDTIKKQPGESMKLNTIKELIQGRELAEQLKLHLSSETSNIDSDDIVQRILSSFVKCLSAGNLSGSQLQNDVAAIVNPTNRPSKSPLYKDAASGSFNFFETVECSALHNGNAKKRKTLPIWTETVRVSSENGLESALDDGYSWIKYGQKDVRRAIYPRSYYRCFYRDTQNCWATKRVKRSDEDPNIFEISYRQVHICSPALPEKQKNMSGSNQQQPLPGTLLNFRPLPNSLSLELDPEVSFRLLQLDLSLT